MARVSTYPARRVLELTPREWPQLRQTCVAQAAATALIGFLLGANATNSPLPNRVRDSHLRTADIARGTPACLLV